MSLILVDVKGNVNRIAIKQDDKLVEYYIEKSEEKTLGNIYRGRVVNVLPGMEAAFVDIGLEKNAYLYLKDAMPKGMRNQKDMSINKVVKNGQEIIVQVIKESIGTKGPKVTTHITIPGRYTVLTPYSNKIKVSRKINDIDDIERLLSIGKEIQKDNMGIILRTISKDVEKEQIEEDMNISIELFKKIEREKNFSPCPKLIYKEMDMVHRIVRDVFINSFDKLIINDKEKYDSIVSSIKHISPELKNNMELRLGEDIFKSFNIEGELKNAFKREVPLKSGGYIVIDEAEALTAIDVNTGHYIGNLSLENTVVKTNLEAAEEIARQLRLRDIGGIIIIDFIDMEKEANAKIVLKRLEEELMKDRTKAIIVDITKLGLVEMTRKKVRNRLSWDFIKTCTHCQGRGKILDYGC